MNPIKLISFTPSREIRISNGVILYPDRTVVCGSSGGHERTRAWFVPEWKAVRVELWIREAGEKEAVKHSFLFLEGISHSEMAEFSLKGDK